MFFFILVQLWVHRKMLQRSLPAGHRGVRERLQVQILKMIVLAASDEKLTAAGYERLVFGTTNWSLKERQDAQQVERLSLSVWLCCSETERAPLKRPVCLCLQGVVTVCRMPEVAERPLWLLRAHPRELDLQPEPQFPTSSMLYTWVLVCVAGPITGGWDPFTVPKDSRRGARKGEHATATKGERRSMGRHWRTPDSEHAEKKSPQKQPQMRRLASTTLTREGNAHTDDPSGNRKWDQRLEDEEEKDTHVESQARKQDKRDTSRYKWHARSNHRSLRSQLKVVLKWLVRWMCVRTDGWPPFASLANILESGSTNQTVTKPHLWILNQALVLCSNKRKPEPLLSCVNKKLCEQAEAENVGKKPTPRRKPACFRRFQWTMAGTHPSGTLPRGRLGWLRADRCLWTIGTGWATCRGWPGWKRGAETTEASWSTGPRGRGEFVQSS